MRSYMTCEVADDLRDDAQERLDRGVDSILEDAGIAPATALPRSHPWPRWVQEHGADCHRTWVLGLIGADPEPLVDAMLACVQVIAERAGAGAIWLWRVRPTLIHDVEEDIAPFYHNKPAHEVRWKVRSRQVVLDSQGRLVPDDDVLRPEGQRIAQFGSDATPGEAVRSESTRFPYRWYEVLHGAADGVMVRLWYGAAADEDEAKDRARARYQAQFKTEEVPPLHVYEMTAETEPLEDIPPWDEPSWLTKTLAERIEAILEEEKKR